MTAWRGGGAKANSVDQGFIVPVPVEEGGHREVNLADALPDIVAPVMASWRNGTGNARSPEDGFIIPVSVSESPDADVRMSDPTPTLMTVGGKPGQGYSAAIVERQPGDPELPDPDEGFSNQYLLPFSEDEEIGGKPTGELFEVQKGLTAKEVIELGRAAIGDTEVMVRRLTPVECERLMGWPDDHTRWADDGSEIAQTARYKMCGNGVASPVAEWLGRQIMAAHAALQQ